MDLSNKVVQYVHVFNGGSDDNTIDIQEWREGCEGENALRLAMQALVELFPEIGSVDDVFEKLHKADAPQQEPLNILQVVLDLRTMSEHIAVALE